MNTQTIKVLTEVLEYSKKSPGVEIKFECQNLDDGNDFTYQGPVSWEVVDYYCPDETVYTDEDSILEEINEDRDEDGDQLQSLDEARKAGYEIDTVLIVRREF